MSTLLRGLPLSRLSSPSSSTLPTFAPNFISKTMNPTDENPLVTRFPPEPNGYLHLGHAKSVLINFGLNKQYSHDGQVRTNVRMDDTNPLKESFDYVNSIIEDVTWLIGAQYFDGCVTSTSSRFEVIEGCAEHLIRGGLAYVDKTGKDEMREMRGTLKVRVLFFFGLFAPTSSLLSLSVCLFVCLLLACLRVLVLFCPALN